MLFCAEARRTEVDALEQRFLETLHRWSTGYDENEIKHAHEELEQVAREIT
jgi:hypothetical protein